MKPQQFILTAAFSGALIAAIIGAKEAIFLLSSTGAPDQISLVYSVILYGLIGFALGFGSGIFGLILSKFIPYFKERPLAIGSATAMLPMGIFILRYQLNKVVYLEQGVPITTLIVVLMGLLILCGLLFYFIPKKLNIGLRGAALGWVELILFFGAISAVSLTSQNPMSKDHGKEIPKALENKPNVIVLMIDTLRADHVGAYHKTDIKTPKLDSLAEDGVLFENCISQASWTRPSGVSMFTGRIPSGHSTQTKAARVPNEAVLFSEVLQKNGVTTGALANNINLTATFNLNQGFDAFLYEEPNYPFWGTESVFGLTLYKVVAKVMERLSPTHRVVHNYYQPADVVLGDAKTFIENNKNSRWMIYAHLMEPHDPYFEHPIISGSGTEEYNGVAYGRAEHEHPDPKDTAYLLKVYKEEIEFLDLELGRFIDWLKANGQYDNSAIIVISDHGEEFGEHGGFWHGTTLYDEVLHVPLIIKTPKNYPKNVRVPWQVRSIDISPTIAQLMGLEADESWEGENLLQEQELKLAQAEWKFDTCKTHELDRVAISENDFEGNILSSIRMENFKYILANQDNPRGLAPEELFALLDDAEEKNNLAEKDLETCGKNTKKQAEQLKTILRELLKEAQETAAQSTDGGLDEATIERMRKLGYME